MTMAIVMCSFLFAGIPGGSTPDAAAAPPTLRPCPSSPNCVSSLSADPARRVDPFPLKIPSAETMARLEQCVRSFPRTTVAVRTGDYLQAAFRTFLGFVDDVEFLIDDGRGVVQVRSASRLGYWDLGVNRKRVEALRRIYMELVGGK
jgi:uncharacterized protein (DUF1499 family)